MEEPGAVPEDEENTAAETGTPEVKKRGRPPIVRPAGQGAKPPAAENKVGRLLE